MKECQRKSKASKVKVEERGKSAIFLNESNDCIVVTRFDGCVVHNKCGADFIIESTGGEGVIVELKGRNVEHAADQAIETIRHLEKIDYKLDRISVLIVCSKFPKAAYSVQKKIEQLKKAGAKTKIACTRWEGTFKMFA